jgi:hypothetical protein
MNVRASTLKGLHNFWNELDRDKELSESIGFAAENLDLPLADREDRLVAEVFQKPSPSYTGTTQFHPIRVADLAIYLWIFNSSSVILKTLDE